jgi:hypothetical protein
VRCVGAEPRFRPKRKLHEGLHGSISGRSAPQRNMLRRMSRRSNSQLLEGQQGDAAARYPFAAITSLAAHGQAQGTICGIGFVAVEQSEVVFVCSDVDLKVMVI